MATEKTAFVMSGGGSLGAVQVGMLKALVAADVMPDLVLGASVGALNAAYFAQYPGSEGVAALEQVWRGIDRNDVFPIQPLRTLLNLFHHGNNLVDPADLRKLLEKHFGGQRIEDSPIPRHIMTTDILDGAEVLLSDGPLVQALLASAAIPVVFPPVRRGDLYLSDGGVSNNTPITRAAALDATRIIVLPTGMNCGRAKPPDDPLEMAVHTLNLLVARRLVRDVEQLKNRVTIRVIPALCPLDVSLFDFTRTGELIERGEQTARNWLANGGLDRPGVPPSVRPHRHGTQAI